MNRKVLAGRAQKASEAVDAKKPELDTWPDSQAKRIIARFGGAYKLHQLMVAAGVRRTLQSLYCWLRSPGGLIPANGILDVIQTEAHCGIRLTLEDWSPYARAETPKPVASVAPSVESKHWMGEL